jgi:hypothetical protein
VVRARTYEIHVDVHGHPMNERRTRMRIGPEHLFKLDPVLALLWQFLDHNYMPFALVICG